MRMHQFALPHKTGRFRLREIGQHLPEGLRGAFAVPQTGVTDADFELRVRGFVMPAVLLGHYGKFLRGIAIMPLPVMAFRQPELCIRRMPTLRVLLAHLREGLTRRRGAPRQRQGQCTLIGCFF